LKDFLEEMTARARRWQDNMDAVQDEIAGRGASRQSRLGRTREEIEARRTGRSTDIGQYANQLQMLLATDPEYAPPMRRL
jgi:hypothetical protein